MNGDRRFDVILRELLPGSQQLEVVSIMAPSRCSARRRAEQLYGARVVGLIAHESHAQHNQGDGHHPSDSSPDG